MHPLEHLVYLSGFLLHWIGDYFHYLHHRYFDCNYGTTQVPLDKWFGSFHDGSPRAHEAMRGRHRRIKLGRKYAQAEAAILGERP